MTNNDSPQRTAWLLFASLEQQIQTLKSTLDPDLGFIYILIDPRTQATRYCGFTTDPRVHDDLYTKPGLPPRIFIPLLGWSEGLRVQNLEPEFRIVEVAPHAHLQEWVTRLTQDGHDLFITTRQPSTPSPTHNRNGTRAALRGAPAVTQAGELLRQNGIHLRDINRAAGFNATPMFRGDEPYTEKLHRAVQEVAGSELAEQVRSLCPDLKYAAARLAGPKLTPEPPRYETPFDNPNSGSYTPHTTTTTPNTEEVPAF